MSALVARPKQTTIMREPVPSSMGTETRLYTLLVVPTDPAYAQLRRLFAIQKHSVIYRAVAAAEV